MTRVNPAWVLCQVLMDWTLSTGKRPKALADVATFQQFVLFPVPFPLFLVGGVLQAVEARISSAKSYWSQNVQ